jgi:hypothetical protein
VAGAAALIVSGSAQAAAAWFSRLGGAFSSSDIAAARAYLNALAYPPSLPIVPVAGWLAAERIVRDAEWDRAWWELEERERVRLTSETTARLGSTQVLERLTAATELASDVVHSAAAAAALRDASGDDVIRAASGADDAMIRAASGAAIMSLHEMALARLAGCGPDHLFMRKYRLFESGRWPLGVLDGAFHLF